MFPNRLGIGMATPNLDSTTNPLYEIERRQSEADTTNTGSQLFPHSVDNSPSTGGLTGNIFSYTPTASPMGHV